MTRGRWNFSSATSKSPWLKLLKPAGANEVRFDQPLELAHRFFIEHDVVDVGGV